MYLYLVVSCPIFSVLLLCFLATVMVNKDEYIKPTDESKEHITVHKKWLMYRMTSDVRSTVDGVINAGFDMHVTSCLCRR